MKHFKMWVVIPMYWIIFVIYTMFLDQISLCFDHYDITQYIDGRVKYSYGPCCLSITVFFMLLILGITLVIVNAVKNKTIKHVKMKAILVSGILVLSFVVQFFMFLSHFSIYFLFGIVLP